MKSKYLLSASFVYALAVPVGNLHAQEAASVQPEVRSTGIEDIVVTATRRDTRLQTTPIAVSAISSQTMDQIAPRDVGDLAAYVPNFSSATIPSFKAAAFAMRGVGVSTIIPFNEAPVGVVFDDFVMPSIQTQLLDTFDLEQIEVLRGPQGTLFGKNTTGGVVVARSKRPELGELGFQVRGEIGSFKTRVFQAAANLPLGDNLALRLVGSYRKTDGYVKNGACFGPITPFSTSDFAQALAGRTGCGDGSGLGGDDVFNGRAKLLWEPTPSISALLQYEIVRDSGEVAGVVNATPPGFLYSNLGFPGGSGDPLERGGLFGGNVGLVDLDKGMRVNVDGVYANIDIDAGPGTISSVTGYRSQRSRLPGNFAGEYSPIALYSASRDDNRRTFQQELRYAASFSDRFDLVAGFFFQKDDIDYCAPTLLGFLDLVSGPGPFGPNSQTPQANCNNQDSRSIAVFAEGNFDITDRLNLTLGGRYSWDKKKFAARAAVFAQALDPDLTWEMLDRSLDFGDFDRFPQGVVRNEQSWSDPTWRISLSYEATPDIFPYVTYARGYKAGGFNEVGQSGVPLIQDQLTPYDPETADSFEVGLKSDLFDRMVRLNLAGFWVTYDDAQRQLLFPFTRPDGSDFTEIRFINAAKVDVKGIEAELTIAPTRGLTLRGTLGYQDGKYKSFNSPTPTARNLAEAPLARTPEWQGSASISYELPVGDIGNLTLFGSLTYTDRTLFNLDLNNPDNDFYLDSKTLLNASIAFTDIDDRYTVRLIGKNLTDELYFTGGQTVGALFRRETYGEPRYFGVEVGLKY
ncbi:TonB-dependent receptor [Novosphingobium marinum]|uniref:Iron complex outermembrane receptor protein n=1 Tax=Novosphingobium marinum TaxID=1514948 RepID=A0A7Y9Y076_9SPHN|nr:TonB-dependent receptor [Novosphingobium marinum]NYH96298.1 iron complex outermembrane receptor protein [Novosphingobium marinum]GGC34113.1 TonB-dependent receptor [Novosphingobium marinum]